MVTRGRGSYVIGEAGVLRLNGIVGCAVRRSGENGVVWPLYGNTILKKREW